ncbi:FKBP-type peptidyl-prolyl cis-trans isomerase [Pedobacter sp. UC225_61]|uniref:FKBP-type peptidyl-prolyl cis-trans isomerase n=1 Tax=Pedobacter sp. UC225_61 TaxID=3374623 RepID=UPI003797BF5C
MLTKADSTFQKRAGEFFQADYKATMDKIKNGEPAKIKSYIADNSLKTKTTASGLNYIISAPGNADRAVMGDTVEVNYTGKLTKKDKDGKYKVFDTSDQKIGKEWKLDRPGKVFGPTKMVMGGTVPGFTEALTMIGKGGKIMIVIPSNLGWGEQGAPQAGIGPYAPVVFDVEIVNIIKGKPAAAAPPVPVPTTK